MACGCRWVESVCNIVQNQTIISTKQVPLRGERDQLSLPRVFNSVLLMTLCHAHLRYLRGNKWSGQRGVWHQQSATFWAYFLLLPAVSPTCVRSLATVLSVFLHITNCSVNILTKSRANVEQLKQIGKKKEIDDTEYVLKYGVEGDGDFPSGFYHLPFSHDFALTIRRNYSSILFFAGIDGAFQLMFYNNTS